MASAALLALAACGGGGNASGASSSASSDTNSTTTATTTSTGSVVTGGSCGLGTAVTLNKPAITSSGATSSEDNSSFYGLNAVVLAYGSSNATNSGGSVTIIGGSITSSGHGANGVFAAGKGASLTASNVTVTTTGERSSAMPTDRGGGTVSVNGGSFKASGMRSAATYSTGGITITSATLQADGAEATVIEGKNTVTISNSTLTSSNPNDYRGIFLFQSFSGDSETGNSTFSMTGGSYNFMTSTGRAFMVSNQTTTINLNGVSISNSAPTLLEAGALSWGTSGANGGLVTFNVWNQVLKGNIVIDAISTLSASLASNSSLSGAVNTANTAKSVSLTLDAGSSWNVTGDSYVTIFINAADMTGATIPNVVGNGYTVHYKSSSNSALGGKTYVLTDGGYLKPV